MSSSNSNALFPFLAVELHARWATGLIFAAPSVGAFGVTVLSGWMGRVRWHGLAIGLSAAGWGLAIAWIPSAVTVRLVNSSRNACEDRHGARSGHSAVRWPAR